MLGVKQKTSKQTDKPTVVTEKGPKNEFNESQYYTLHCIRAPENPVQH